MRVANGGRLSCSVCVSFLVEFARAGGGFKLRMAVGQLFSRIFWGFFGVWVGEGEIWLFDRCGAGGTSEVDWLSGHWWWTMVAWVVACGAYHKSLEFHEFAWVGCLGWVLG